MAENRCFSGFLTAQYGTFVGLADIKNNGGDFVGIEYKRYPLDVQVSEQPFHISPYLDKLTVVLSAILVTVPSPASDRLVPKLTHREGWSA